MRKVILMVTVFAHLTINNAFAQTWSALGSGVGSYNYGSVLSSVIYNGDLYVGGYFTNAGGINANNIARWNGINWSPVSGGINGFVETLCVHNGELYVGGSFTSAGTTAAKDIAKWNGTNWTNVGNAESYSINSLVVYNGELYASGYFIFPGLSYGIAIAKWDGNNWTAVGPSTDYYTISINCMEVYNGELYAAGAYYLIGGGGLPEFYRILKWNGFSWSTVVTMQASYTFDGALGDIFSMKAYNGELYVAGQFSGIDTILASQIARWNGNNWSAVGSGINFESFPYGIDGSYYTYVKSLEVYNGALYATGFFNHCDTIITRSIAKWDGTSWSNLGLGLVNNYGIGWGYGFTMTGTDTALFVGGIFNYVNGYNGIPANNIAAWKDSCTAPPIQPAIIYGDTNVCANTQQTFFVNEIPGNTNYTWTLPPGWIGNSTTNSITVMIGDTGGTISVNANNVCGSSIAQTLAVTVTPGISPVIQSNITGNNLPCTGSTQTYFINSVVNANDYTWGLPLDWSGYSTDTSITVTVGQVSGTIIITANNECGHSIPQILPVTVATLPEKPDFIGGKQFVCKGDSNEYYVYPSRAATNYTWILPPGWTGNSNTGFITAVAGSNNGIISVNAYNNCGSSAFITLPLFVDSIPSRPGNIAGNFYTTTNHVNYYSIDSVAGAVGYIWSSTGAVIQGQNSKSISAIWKQAGIYELSVQALNKCGTSAARKITVIVSDYNDLDPFDLQIFPNPSNGDFYLKAKRIQNKKIRIEVLAVTGQLVYNSGYRIGSNDYTQFINLKKLSQGSYIIKITIDDNTFSRKIVKHS